ncbi:hypothetical protein [Coxiella-like endosymbiont]|uniref:hypothetical protein n=1 Tax=Coxiella-like endosymbiont TaxID=1592897 RepID=UPI003F730C84
MIENYLGVEIDNRRNNFKIIDIPKSVDKEVLLHIRDINYQTPESFHKEKAEYELKVPKLQVKARYP